LPGKAAPHLPTLFVLGDSISIHYGPTLERLLAGRFACDRKGSELLEDHTRVENGAGILQRLAALDSGLEAINGGDSASVLVYLQAKSATQASLGTVLLLNCGLHDVRRDPRGSTRQVEPGDYAANLNDILQLATRLSQHVVWLRNTPVVDELHQRLNPEFTRFNADVELYNQIADTLTDEAGIPSIDLYWFTRKLSPANETLEQLYCDHVHFSEPVRQMQAAYIAGWLEAYIHA
jgi:lysophospholipase L1-like esterase